MRTPTGGDGVPKQYPPPWEQELTVILDSLPEKGRGSRKTPSVAKMASKLAELYLEHERLVAALAEQKVEYLEHRNNSRKFSKDINAKLQHLFETTGKAALFDAE